MPTLKKRRNFISFRQYIRGETLAHELTDARHWSEGEVIDLLQDLLQILDFVHQNGVIHRDIKPDNLIRRTLDRQTRISRLWYGQTSNVNPIQGNFFYRVRWHPRLHAQRTGEGQATLC